MASQSSQGHAIRKHCAAFPSMSHVGVDSTATSKSRGRGIPLSPLAPLASEQKVLMEGWNRR